MTGTGITLRQLLMNEELKTQFAKGVSLPIAEATKGLATTQQMLRLQADLGVIAQAGAKAFMGQQIKGVNAGALGHAKGVNAGVLGQIKIMNPAIISALGALPTMPKMELPTANLIRVVAINPAFQAHQQRLSQIVSTNVTAGLGSTLASLQTLAAASAVAKATKERATEQASDELEYGSRQMSLGATLLLALTLQPFIQSQIETDTDRHLGASDLLTVCLVIAIWCMSAVIP